MNYRVDVVTVTAQPIAVVRRQAKQAELSRVVPAACGEVWNFVKAAGIPAATAQRFVPFAARRC